MISDNTIKRILREAHGFKGVALICERKNKAELASAYMHAYFACMDLITALKNVNAILTNEERKDNYENERKRYESMGHSDSTDSNNASTECRSTDDTRINPAWKPRDWGECTD